MNRGFTQIIIAVLTVVIGAIMVLNVGIPVLQSVFGTQGNATTLGSTGINYSGIPGGWALTAVPPLLLLVGLVLLAVGGFVYIKGR